MNICFMGGSNNIKLMLILFYKHLVIIYIKFDFQLIYILFLRKKKVTIHTTYFVSTWYWPDTMNHLSQ
jgi:hypothetical protein